MGQTNAASILQDRYSRSRRRRWNRGIPIRHAQRRLVQVLRCIQEARTYSTRLVWRAHYRQGFPSDWRIEEIKVPKSLDLRGPGLGTGASIAAQELGMVAPL